MSKAPKSPPHELVLFIAPRVEACEAAMKVTEEVAAQLNLPSRVLDASLPENGRFVLGLNVAELPTLLLLKKGRVYKSFIDAKDFKTNSLRERLAKLLVKEAE